MNLKITALLCLLTSLVGVTSGLATPTQLRPSRELIAQTSPAESTPTAVLTADDLPAGFVAIPPEVREQVIGQFGILAREFGQDSLEIKNLFGFFNLKEFQAVLGFTGELPTASEQESFDNNLQRLQDPKVQEQILSRIQEKLKDAGDVEVTNYRLLPELNTLGDASVGLSLELAMEGELFEIELVAFRRQSTGAFTAVVYPQSGEAIALKGLAETLDRRIGESSSSGQLSR